MPNNLLAQVCRICPACIFKRRFPDSGYGRLMERLERACPFCRAYNRVYGPPWGRQQELPLR